MRRASARERRLIQRYEQEVGNAAYHTVVDRSLDSGHLDRATLLLRSWYRIAFGRVGIGWIGAILTGGGTR